jgi:hypothetical protein
MALEVSTSAWHSVNTTTTTSQRPKKTVAGTLGKWFRASKVTAASLASLGDAALKNCQSATLRGPVVGLPWQTT